MRVEVDTTDRISLRDFYIRRVFRILPLFYVVLALGLLAVAFGFGGGRVSTDATVAQLTHWFNIFAIGHAGFLIVPGTGIYWSLAIEEHFYLVFPVLMVLLHRLGLDRVRQAAVLLAGCAVVLAWRLYLVYGADVAPGAHVLRHRHALRRPAVRLRGRAGGQPGPRPARRRRLIGPTTAPR